jgi:two-component system LytT family response regulator
MKTLIIEDEVLAAKHLQAVLKETGDIHVIAVIESIAETVEWFKINPQPELIFMDIHLADGSAFEIFKHTEITCPVIFTTAYDEYALKAFKVNSVDYLLKPVDLHSVQNALEKLRTLSSSGNIQREIQNLIGSLADKKTFKTHFLVQVKGNKLVPLLAKDIAFIFIEYGQVKATTTEAKTYPLEYTLDELANILNPTDFFRANRQFIISRHSIKDMDLWFKNKLSVNLKVPVSEKILVSKARVSEFREWYAGIS